MPKGVFERSAFDKKRLSEQLAKYRYKNHAERKTGKNVSCANCGKIKYVASYLLKKSKSGNNFCSKICANRFRKYLTKEHKEKISKGLMGHKGVKHSEATKKLISENSKGHHRSIGTEFKKGQVSPRKGIRLDDKIKQKISKKLKGRKLSAETRKRMSESFTKERKDIVGKVFKNRVPWNWIEDRTKLKKYLGSEERRSPAYKYWMLSVKKRDGWKCKISNKNCKGRLEAHHILGWTDHPELRYEINNGITLCHFHHPRKRIDEQKMIPIFKKLI